MENLFLESAKVQTILDFHCPRYEELPAIGLYSDQVVRFLGDALDTLYAPCTEKEKIITKAMVNNYVKQRIIAPPVGKLYSNEQLAYLVAISLLKRTLSIADIGRLLQLQQESYPLDIAYNYFSAEVENALNAVFKKSEEMPVLYTERTPQTDLIRSMTLAFANEVYIRQYLQFVKEQGKQG